MNNLPLPTSAAIGKWAVCFLTGNLIWTILEYTMHRFLFHIDDMLPDRNWALLLHFLLHGIHHYLPMDRLRLVMPPTLFLALETPFTSLAHFVFPKAIANGIISGAFTFCKLLVAAIRTVLTLPRHLVRLHALCAPPHQAARVPRRDEEVPPCAPLQEYVRRAATCTDAD